MEFVFSPCDHSAAFRLSGSTRLRVRWSETRNGDKPVPRPAGHEIELSVKTVGSNRPSRRIRNRATCVPRCQSMPINPSSVVVQQLRAVGRDGAGRTAPFSGYDAA